MGIERREQQRFPLSGDAYFISDGISGANFGEVGVGSLRNASRGGFCWCTDVPLHEGDWVRVSLELSADTEPISLQGQVVWVSQRCSGVLIDEPSGEYITAFDAWSRRYLKKAKPREIHDFIDDLFCSGPRKEATVKLKLDEQDEALSAKDTEDWQKN
jgi:hypothetical protein